jgi:hypothetical protein
VTRMSVLVITVAGLIMGCTLLSGERRTSDRPDDPETNVAKAPLPGALPSVHRLDFEETDGGAELKPKGRTPLAAPTSTPTEDAGSGVSAQDLQGAAVKDPRVAHLLGERFVLTNVETTDSAAKLSLGCCRTSGRRSRLVFFSYTNSVTLEVWLKELAHAKEWTVAAAERREKYQPPETEQEIQQAIDLARKDPGLIGKLDGLTGHALLMEPEQGLLWNDPGYGHRVLWVTFSKGEEGKPHYWAIVDLSDQKVLKAREEPQE